MQARTTLTDQIEETAAGDSIQPAPPAKENPFPGLLAQYTSQIRSIRRCAKEHIQLAKNATEEWKKGFVVKVQTHLIKPNEDGQTSQINIDNLLQEEISYHLISPHSDILSQSLLIFGFSAFDAFLGAFLTRLYSEHPKLIYKFEEKEIKVGEVLRSSSIDELKDRIIQRDISSLLRKSYDKQFAALANRHGISTLTKFPSWAPFVEASQRRNLITHCNGVVNPEYLEKCRVAGALIPESVVVGSQLTADDEYVKRSLDLLYEVGFKLAMMLWRTAIPSDTATSDRLLIVELFELLKREEFHLAKIMGEFVLNIISDSDDLNKRIVRINYAQAVKWAGDPPAAMKLLSALDWSSSIRDLRLGVAVLREEFDSAANLMREIGKTGELISEARYKDWPVFREFRKDPRFIIAFKEIYEKDFEITETELKIHVAGAGDDASTTAIGSDTIPRSHNQEGDSGMLPFPPGEDSKDDGQSDQETKQQ